MAPKSSPDRVNEFFNAIETDDLVTVQDMLSKGMDPNVRLAHCPAIYAAAEADSAPIVKALLEAGADPNQQHGSKLNDCPMSALNMASSKANLIAIDLLLDAGADVAILSNDSRTAAHYLLTDHRAMQSPPSEDELIKRLNRFLDKGIAVNAVDDYKLSLLHACAHSRQGREVGVSLIERGADPHLISANGDQAIHLAARRGQPAMVKLLLETGVNVDATTASGKTALFVCEGSEIGPLLLDAGANIHHRDAKGDTALHVRLRSSYDYIENDHVLFLISAGANIHAHNKKGELPRDIVERRRLKWCEPALAAATARQAMMATVAKAKAARPQ